jgi:hypothetical protein
MEVKLTLRPIFLSSIFNWYEKDFLIWYQNQFPDQKATILDYIALYLPKDKADVLQNVLPTYAVHFVSYDWHLNNHK